MAHCDLMRLVRSGLYDSLLEKCDHAANTSTGFGSGCYIEKVLERQEELSLSRKEISSVQNIFNYILRKLICDAGSLVQRIWGAESSASFLQAFMLALLSYPDCQKHIQA